MGKYEQFTSYSRPPWRGTKETSHNGKDATHVESEKTDEAVL
jgi:hypothetical protein